MAKNITYINSNNVTITIGYCNGNNVKLIGGIKINVDDRYLDIIYDDIEIARVRLDKLAYVLSDITPFPEEGISAIIKCISENTEYSDRCGRIMVW